MDSNPLNLLTERLKVTISTWAPTSRIITDITRANPGVVTTSQSHGFLDGLYVRIDMQPKPSLFGMTQVSGQIYLITVINSTSFSINENTSNFDSFIAITDPQAPQAIPVGEVATTLQNLERNTLTPYGG
jgi:hypothetical protein